MGLINDVPTVQELIDGMIQTANIKRKNLKEIFEQPNI